MLRGLTSFRLDLRASEPQRVRRIYAENAWLGPGEFVQRVVVSFDTQIRDVRALGKDVATPPDMEQAGWLSPGFVNAHCHLEYSYLEKDSRLPAGPVPFGEWMAAIVQASLDRNHPDVIPVREAAMAKAATTLLRGGCTMVFDSTTDGSSAAHLAQAGLRSVLFYEVLGLTNERAQLLWDQAQLRLRRDHASGQPAGLNPHAPYSVGTWLRQKLLHADFQKTPQAWHLAETGDEDELFRCGTGSIADFLKRHNMPMPYSANDRTEAPGVSAFKYLEQEKLLSRCAIAFHGNTLNRDEARFFSGGRALVHCPSTHNWFQRPPVPLKAWLNDGVNVCLGTDSLASSATLSMLDVVRLTLKEDPDISADEVLQMACTNPARIAPLPGVRLPGALSRGNVADFITFEGAEEHNNWRCILSASGTVVEKVYSAGKQLL